MSTQPTSTPSKVETKARRLARPLEIEHVYVPDREAMAAALRVVLGLPRILPGRRGQEPR